MSDFDDLMTPDDASGVRAKVIGYAQGALLSITDWIVGGDGQQMLETIVASITNFTGGVAQAVRGFASLDTSTDPGDVDSFNPGNVDLPWSPGFLSNLGKNTYGTTREGATFAEGAALFVNASSGAGGVARTFKPGGLVWNYPASPTSPVPTYRNVADPAIYTNVDGSVTVAAGSSISLPIAAEVIGTDSNAPSSTLVLVTSLVGVTATNPAAILGTDREDAEVYRARCRAADARLSLGGPGAIYQYLAAKNLDGSPLLNVSGAAVAITRVAVSPDSSTGIVNVYYASDAGTTVADDVTAANNNITSQAAAVMGAITFTGAAATPVAIHVSGTARIKAASGVTALGVAAAIASTNGPLARAFRSYPIGGRDQDVTGAGVIYTADIRDGVAPSFPGLYDVAITTPAGSTTALPAGHVATLTSAASDWTITVVP